MARATDPTRLTPGNAKRLRPGQELTDDVVRGLSLRRGAEGASYYLYYRQHGIRRRPRIGGWPDLTIEQAREVSRAMLQLVALGQDPSRARQQARAAPTIAALWTIYERWLVANRGETTVGEYRRIYRAVIAPHPIAGERVADVTLSQVETWHRDVRERRFTRHAQSGRKEAPAAASRALAVMSGMLSHAETRLDPPWRARNTNPCAGIAYAPVGRRDRYATAAELAAIGAWLAAEAACDPVRVTLLRLHLLTGARTGELAGARWRDVDLDAGRLTLTRHKTARTSGTKQLELAPEVTAALAELRPAAWRPVDKVFPGLAREKVLRALWERCREACGCPDLQIRDLRRTYASVAYNAGADRAVIGGLLGHASTKTTEIYTHLFSERRRHAAHETAARVDALLAGRTPENG